MQKKRLILLGLIVLLGMILRLTTYGFIKIPWIIYDEFVYLDTARQISSSFNFVSKLTRDQLYPPGWPIILASVIGFFSNPFWQYKVGLIIVALLSSGTAIIGYFLFNQSLIVALGLVLYPNLFVYSSNILSETFYTFILLLFVWCLELIIKNDLGRKKELILSSLVIAFLLYYARLVRSFGALAAPAFILAQGTYLVIFQKSQFKKSCRNLLYFGFLVTIVILFLDLFKRKIWLHSSILYETEAYTNLLKNLFTHAKKITSLVSNETVGILFSQFWVLPLFYLHEFYHNLKTRKAELIIPRLFVLYLFLGSLGLTLLHQLKSVYKNPQYLLLSRYIDPNMVLLFIYGWYDVWSQKKHELPKWLITFYSLFVGYFLYYLHTKFYFGSYKYGNMMPWYYLKHFATLPYFLALICLLLVFVYAFFQRKRRFYLAVLLFLSVFLSFLSIRATLAVPEYVNKQYQVYVDDWKNIDLGINICIPNNNISEQHYYLYHFLSPAHYLGNCQAKEVKASTHRVLFSAWQKYVLDKKCILVHRFLQGKTMLYYCPKIK